jgi:hypothetical protein
LYPKQGGPLQVGQRQIKEIVYFGPLKPRSPWETMTVVLKTFAHVNQLAAPMDAFAGSCKVGVCMTGDVQREVCQQIPLLRREYPGQSFIVQTGAQSADPATDQAQYAVLTVLNDRQRRTVVLEGTIQFPS